MTLTEPDSPRQSPRRRQPLLVVLAAVCLGVVVDRTIGPTLAVWWALAVASWISWWILSQKRRDWMAALAILLAAGATAAAWHHLRWSQFRADDLGCFTSATAQPVCVEAVVYKGTRRLPRPKYDPMQIIPHGDRTRLELSVEKIRDGTRWRHVSGQVVLLVDGHLLGVHSGDRVRVFGQLISPRAALNPGEFDRAEHLRADRRRAELRANYPQCITVVDHAGPWRPRRWLEAIQNRANNALWSRLYPCHAGLASALLLGQREALEPARATAFAETGTVHLLAISGLHVGIVVLALAWLFRFLRVPQVPAIVLVATAAVAYTILTDARPSAVRASILVVIFAMAIVLGRRPVRFNSLAAAALVVLALNPADLFRIGPQLSFLAVAALMWIVPRWFGERTDSRLDYLVDKNRPWWSRWFRASMRPALQLTMVSAVIWLVTSPLVMARFHLFTPVGIVLNTVLWIPMTLTLCSGLVLLTLGWVPLLGTVAAWVCNESLGFMDWAIGVSQQVPLGHSWVPGPAEWWLGGFYAGLLLVAVAGRWRPPCRWLVAILAAWIGVGFLGSVLGRESDRLECTFLAVGHGSAVVLQLPEGGTILYDAGSLGSPYLASQSIAGCLWSKGITQIDAVVLSHADADHYNALPGLLRRFSVAAVYISPAMSFDDNQALKALRRAIDEAGVPIRELAAGDRLVETAGCQIEVLYPVRYRLPDNKNASSLVLLVDYAGKRILLPGDLEPPGLDDVLAEEPVDCDILMVPHHGSGNSNPPGLAAWCRPELAVISGSLARNNGTAEQAYHEAGTTVLHTGHGAVEVVVNDGE